MMRDTMLDIETLGTGPGSVVLSIGAVGFDDSYLGAEFYREIDVDSCTDVGLEVDQNTLEWWHRQDDDVSAVLEGGDPLSEVLESFTRWLPNEPIIWANSPSFDCVILETAYDVVSLDVPWEYYNQRDVRTLQELPFAADVDMEGNDHHALDDAKHQARLVQETLTKLVDSNS